MQRLKLSTTWLMGSCLLIGTIAAAEPVTKPAPKKHPECEGSKVKTSCNQQADVKELLMSRQSSTSQPTAGGQQAAVAASKQDVQSAKDSADPQQPR